ncbi:MAG: glycosyltransferase [Pseudomonadota bacterium]
MKIGYLMNTYPVTSGTFIRREIHALEAQGAKITRYAIRRWDQDLVDPRDREEQERTRYLLSGEAVTLVTGFLAALVTRPQRIARAIGPWFRLIRNAGGGVVRHSAYLMEAVALLRATERDRIAHIHTHFSTNAAAVAMLCHLMGGPRFSFTAHGPDEFTDPGPSSLAQKIKSAAFVSAISHYCRRTLILAGGPETAGSVHIVRCGLDLAEFPVSDAGFDTGTIVCVGRLCPQKAQHLIPGAAVAAANAHPDLRIILIGDGETRGAIEAEIARQGLTGRIDLLGWQSNAEVRAHISSARALLLPSFAEGLPIVLMEALALGRPVITTFIAGIPELVDREVGWIVPAGDTGALAKALVEVMETSPDRLAEMGQTGRARIERFHDQHKNASDLHKLFASAGEDGDA